MGQLKEPKFLIPCGARGLQAQGCIIFNKISWHLIPAHSQASTGKPLKVTCKKGCITLPIKSPLFAVSKWRCRTWRRGLRRCCALRDTPAFSWRVRCRCSCHQLICQAFRLVDLARAVLAHSCTAPQPASGLAEHRTTGSGATPRWQMRNDVCVIMHTQMLKCHAGRLWGIA